MTILFSFSVLLILLLVNFGSIQSYLLPFIEQKYSDGLFRIPKVENEKIVVLTIDDGISEQSMKILDLLDQYNAKATFFIHQKDSQEVTNYQQVISEILNQGHELGNHTTQDIPSNSLSKKEFAREFKDADSFLRQFGVQPRFFRAAGGLYNSSIMKPLLVEHNYREQFIMGSFLPWDTFLPLPEVYAHQLVNNIFSGAIVVFHDGTQKGEDRLNRTFIALKIFLQQLTENSTKNYQIVSLAEALSKSQS